MRIVVWQKRTISEIQHPDDDPLVNWIKLIFNISDKWAISKMWTRFVIPRNDRETQYFNSAEWIVIRSSQNQSEKKFSHFLGSIGSPLRDGCTRTERTSSSKPIKEEGKRWWKSIESEEESVLLQISPSVRYQIGQQRKYPKLNRSSSPLLAFF